MRAAATRAAPLQAAQETMAEAVLRFDFPERRLRFGRPQRIIAAHTAAEVVPALEVVQQAAAGGQWAAGFVAYEAAAGLDPALCVRAPAGGVPLAWFAIYDAAAAACDGSAESSAAGAQRAIDAHGDAPPLMMVPDATPSEHAAAIARIRSAIGAGAVYQVNHTLRLRGRVVGELDALAARLARAQGRGYFADLALPGGLRVVSVSPELFFQVRGRTIVTRPMKGTMRRGRWPADDDAAAARLATSEKERAENLMIVDLMRNDLGRVARFGSVRVPRLFAIERYPTVHQMTSTVAATLHERADLVAVFRALFPCGSVTGAPKVAAMRFIAALETSPRGVYCGAIGYVEPGGDCTFSVAIRTLVADTASGAAEYGTGGGITWDSSPADEYDEALAKADVLRRPWPDFSLLETLRLDETGLVRVDRHLARMAASAAYFDRRFDEATTRRALAARTAGREGRWRVRLLLAPDGVPRVEATPLGAPDDANASLCVRLVRGAVRSDDPFLYHKTTRRGVYDAAKAGAHGADEVLLVNERGELTELAAGNLIVEIGGVLLTPARGSGLLSGVFREMLLESGRVAERVLRPADLAAARRCWLINSVREWVPIARVVDASDTTFFAAAAVLGAAR